MSDKLSRRPIGNFFIQRDLQLRLVFRIVLAVILSTLITAATLLLVHYLRFESIIFYQLNAHGDLYKEDIVQMLLPTIAISAGVNIIVGICVGLYASRKYAVPIFKLEQWASLLREGNLTAQLKFREKEEMKDLSDQCNLLADSMRTRFMEINRRLETLRKECPDSEAVVRIQEVLSGVSLDTDTIEVNTSYVNRPM